jgi:hypothetical protein
LQKTGSRTKRGSTTHHHKVASAGSTTGSFERFTHPDVSNEGTAVKSAQLETSNNQAVVPLNSAGARRVQ